MLISLIARLTGMVCLGGIGLGAFFLQGQSSLVLLADLYLIATGLLLASSLFSASRAGIDYMFSFFCLFFLALPARVQISMDAFPWFATFHPRELILAYALLAISQLFYCLGQILAEYHSNLKETEFGEQAASEHSRTSFDRRTQLHLAKWGLSIIFLSLLFSGAAGPDRLLQARFGAGEVDEGMSAQFLFIARSMSLLGILILILLARFADSPRLRIQMGLFALIYLPVFLVVNYPPALARFTLFGVLIALSCTVLDYRRPAVKLVTFLISVVTLFMVFPMIKLLGQEGTQITDVLNALGFRSLSVALLNVDFDAFMQAASTIQYFSQHETDLRWGNNFLGMALFFIPRALWPDKPLPTGRIVSEELGYWYTNVASPLPAETLLGFGLLGPLLVFFALGLVVTRLERPAMYFGSAASLSPAFFAYVLGMSFAVILLRGSLNAVAAQIMTGFYMSALMSWALTRSRQINSI